MKTKKREPLERFQTDCSDPNHIKSRNTPSHDIRNIFSHDFKLIWVIFEKVLIWANIELSLRFDLVAF